MPPPKLSLLSIVLLSFQLSLNAEPAIGWRGFTSVDGLRESYCSKLSVGPSGRVFIIHGHTDRMSVLDGYTIRQLPVPGVEVKATEGTTGEIWAFAPEGIVPNPADLDEQQKLIGLQRYSEQEGRWEVFEIPEIRAAGLQSPDPFLPLGTGIVVYLLPDRLMEFNAVTRSSRTLLRASETGLGDFVDLKRSADGGFWIGGRNGLGHYHSGGGVTWREYPLRPLGAVHNVSRIRETHAGVVYAVVAKEQNHSQIVVRLSQGRWERIAESEEDIVGWEAEDGGYWLVQGGAQRFTVSLFDGLRTHVEERIKPLSGTFRQADLGPDGSFWIATNISAVRNAPSAWRTPPVLGGIDTAVASMAEDRRGILYFVAYDRLYTLSGEALHEYPYPDGMHADLYQQSGTAFLEDGRLTIATSRIALLTFDLRSGSFRVVKHPAGNRVRALGTRKAGGIWVALYQKDSANYRMAYYDGNGFHEYLDLKEKWRINHLRTICEPRDGSVWMGGAGSDGLGVFRNGIYHTLTAQDGYTAGGSYAMLENPDGSLWLGDRDGIQQYDGNQWKTISQGLETVRWMQRARDGSVWVASGAGLHRWFLGSWVSLGVPEGLPDGGFFYVYEDSQGRIWACGTRGISVYHPDADRDPPRTFVPEEKNLRQVSSQGEVRVVFSGTDRWHFSDSSRLLYSHRLDQGSWSPFHSETVAVFKKVRSGNHSFEVRAMDRNWNIDPDPAVFQFKVLLPWYREPGFVALLASVIVLAVLLLALHLQRHVRLGQLVAIRTAELTTANEQLKKEIEERERTAKEKESLEEQYRQSQKMEAIGRLSGGVAHDFNNLLTVINGYSDLALETVQAESPTSLYIREIRKAGRRGAALTQQLLAFSRKQLLQPVILDLHAAIRDAEHMLQRVIGENIQLSTHLETSPGAVRADPSQIHQVLLNLVINAKDAMPGGGTLTIQTRNVDIDEDFTRLHRGSAAGPYVLFCVSDTGVGMDEETQAHIFEPFFTTKARGKGTGLGLSMVFGIVKQSGGYIWVESRPGKGSAFHILLPRLDDVVLSSTGIVSGVADGNGKETILVVEDEEEVRKIACTVLRKSGYDVLEAEEGSKAISLARNHVGLIHALITDVVMPGITGREVAEQLAADRPDIRILFTSGYADDPVIHQAVTKMNAHFLQKPFSPSALVAKVREILDGDAHGSAPDVCDPIRNDQPTG
jgi:signal transduction histidine kinase/ActR/RegA family two-component response regulator